MEDNNCWKSKFKACRYARKLLNKLLLLNEKTKSKVDIIEIKKSMYYAKKYHSNQKRDSGEPYYSHPIEVAYMISEYTSHYYEGLFRTDMLVTSILHDTIEDTKFNKELIAKIFGELVAAQVYDVTRIKIDRKINATEALNLLLSQNKEDMLHIKLFDRLHNMRTIFAKPPEKAKKIALETLESFVPLAAHLKIIKVEEELTSICYKVLNQPNLTRSWSIMPFSIYSAAQSISPGRPKQ